jgi:integrase
VASTRRAPMSRPRKARRRGSGEGSIYQRTRTYKTKGGKSQARTYWVAVTSGEFGKEFAGATAEQAREKRDSYLAENGKPLPRSERTTPVTVSEFSVTFLEHRKAHKRAATYRDYENTLRLHVLPYIGALHISDLNDDHVKAMYARLKSKVSSSMQKRVHVSLRAMLNYALECKVIRSSPLASIRQNVPRYKPVPVTPLDDDQAGNLLEASEGNRLAALFVLALDTGMRQGELFALRWADVDLAKGHVYVQRAASETADGVTLDYCKTEKSRRKLEITKTSVEALRHRMAIAMREGLGDCELCFPCERGRVMRKSNFVRRVWEPIRNAAKLPCLKFHNLRHTAAVLLLKADVHPKIVSDRLGARLRRNHSRHLQRLDTKPASEGCGGDDRGLWTPEPP